MAAEKNIKKKIPQKSVQARHEAPGEEVKKTRANIKVLIALSGGIDSAVSAALLLQAGYTVEAAFMKNWSSTEGLKYDECPWLIDRQEALRVAAFLGIPLHTLDFEKEYQKSVLNYFYTEYKAGRTPNPDVMCNKEIKFKMLYNWAMKQGFDYLATGHYAVVKSLNTTPAAANNSLGLFRSADELKDQTYFIYNIKAEQLPNLLFPIGHLKKTAVKQLAKKLRLPNATRKESMGLCFVGKIRLKAFLDQKLKPKKGNIRTSSGEIIGEHWGVAYYTIGQRHGLNLSNGPWFVVRKNIETNEIIVTRSMHEKQYMISEIQLHSMHWITEPQKFPLKLQARCRHQGELLQATVKPLHASHGDRISAQRKSSKNKNQLFVLTFKEKQEALASGQSIVFYKGTQCIGGGVIV